MGTDGKCYDCGLKYGEEFGDLIVPDKIWKKINPIEEYEDSGLLCPTCITQRMRRLKLWNDPLYLRG